MIRRDAVDVHVVDDGGQVGGPAGIEICNDRLHVVMGMARCGIQEITRNLTLSLLSELVL